MQHNIKSCFVPVLSSHAGLCLTGENWEELKITTAAYHLSELLMKPGFSVLKGISDIASYVGWHRSLVLNASMLIMNKEGDFTLRSKYDGSRLCYSLQDIIELIVHLNPTMVLLPQGIHQHNRMVAESLPASIMPSFMPSDLPADSGNRRSGVYFLHDKSVLLNDFMARVTYYTDRIRYVVGDFDLASIERLVETGIDYIESDRLAADALDGFVYRQTQVLSITDLDKASVFDVIDPDCKCPTCTQGFTQAYLHHLLGHTPLLCQRFLIQHNIQLVFREDHSTCTQI